MLRLTSMRLGIIGVGAFTGYVSRRFWNDHAFSKAAALGYELLFGLVPVIAIGLAVLAAFPVFDQVRIDLQDYIAKSFLPEHGEEVKTLFQRFVANTRELTLFSIVALIVTAILLFDTVDGVFSHIWRQTVPRPLLTRVAMFWAIMTLLPLLIAGSVALSTFIAHRIGVWDIEFPLYSSVLVWLAPFSLLTIAFALCYIGLPYRRVRLVHALVGGVIAALLFQALQFGYSLFIKAFPTYWTVYGVMAWAPIALLWIYLFWCIVLLGAETTAALPEWRNRPRRGGVLPLPLRRLTAALAILDQLLVARTTGRSASLGRLADVASRALTDADAGAAQEILDRLARARIIARTSHGWQVARDPAKVSLRDLVAALDLGYKSTAQLDVLAVPWGARLGKIMREFEGAGEPSLAITIEDLLATPRDSEAGMDAIPLEDERVRRHGSS
jgi:membrane protein